MIIPAGLSSEASFGEEKFIVQTEFAQRPKPRVTTTISINGAVVEKVENVWKRLPQTEEDQEEIERFLKKQHQQVLEKIKEKKEKLVSFEPDNGETVPSENDTILKIRDELSRTVGVIGWMFLPDERMMVPAISEPKDPYLEELGASIKDLSLFLLSFGELGDFMGGILNLPESATIFLPLQRNFLAVKLDSQMDFKKLVNRIKSISY